jgi:hypothetical protein
MFVPQLPILEESVSIFAFKISQAAFRLNMCLSCDKTI